MKRIAALWLALLMSLSLLLPALAEEEEFEDTTDNSLLVLFNAFPGTVDTPEETPQPTMTPRHTVLAWEEPSGLPMLRAGKNFFYAVDVNGGVWTWGSNSYGQLGLKAGKKKKVDVPTRIELPFDGMMIRDIQCGGGHTLILTEDGSVWSSGYNGNGQLGRGENGRHASSFGKVDQLSGIRAIACGSNHCLALDEQGLVWSWGNGTKGQLGHGNTKNAITPEVVEGVKQVTAIACGADFSLALTEEGVLYSWGDNKEGQQLKLSHWGWSSVPEVLVDKDIAAIAAGSASTYAIDVNGQLWGWGDNDHYQLGVHEAKTHTNNAYMSTNVPEDFQIRHIEVYDKTAVLMATDGRVGILGETSFGQLGNNTHPWHTLYAELPVRFVTMAAAADEAVALMQDDGTVLVAGSTADGKLGIPGYYRKLLQKYNPNGLNLLTGTWTDPGPVKLK